MYRNEIFQTFTDDGIEQPALMAKCGKWGKIGFSKAMSSGWILIQKSQVRHINEVA